MPAAPKINSGDIPSRQINFPYQPGKDPETDAWHTIFLIENHLDYYGYPEMVASPEQTRFMVRPEENERYYPCSDETFDAIINRKRPRHLNRQYNQILQRLLALIDDRIPEKKDQDFLKSLIRIKFDHETRDRLIIPSRLEKRLLRIFLNWSQIDDPWLYAKGERNRRAEDALQSKAFNRALNHIDHSSFKRGAATLAEMKKRIVGLELKRLLTLTTEKPLWETGAAADFTEKDFLKLFERKLKGNGVDPLFDFLGVRNDGESAKNFHDKKILWLADEAGEVMIDFAIIRYLTRLGHKIIVAFKAGPLFTKVDFHDAREDPVMVRELQGAYFISEPNMSKNDLVRILTSDDKIFTLSDGTRETLNLLLCTTTFARVFREVDGVISRGAEQKKRFFDTHFQFTQDIFNISAGKNRSVSISYKPRHPAVIKFSHQDLEKKAREITEQMIQAKKRGHTVIFYSAIIGSIPGKVTTAKKVIAAFIDSLTRQSAGTFIINPSEYYEPGMDADDLMYMWEIVQRSGYIDIWRFQTYEDIVKAFQILQQKVPPEWVGKDATYSTGCTKEMAIALDVLKKHPEMQIIGPAKEKFMRRKEYGVGKMFDQRLIEISEF